MQKHLRSIIILTCILIGLPQIEINAQACSMTDMNSAAFSYFQYIGNDDRFNQPIDKQNQYFNPIISGFYPDPSICRKGEDYYMVHSTFAYYPGIPIFHSKDLVNWTQIGFVLNRPSQLNLDGLRISRGIYAPAIEYNEYNDTFYVITTCVDGIGNFFVKTKDPHKGEWSDPITLPGVGGIDPSFFFDEEGKAYIVHNDAPEGTPEWDGHRAIWIHDFDVDTDKTFGKRKVILDGGVDRSTKPVWIEGPHIYKINGRYYLMDAEGGTSVHHSQVILSSDSIKGPYSPDPNNPILTQRDLPEDRDNAVTSVGHADLIETPDGEWYAVFLGCRPYAGNHYNTGRETFLLPVKWENGYPIILDKGKPVPIVVDKKGLSPSDNTLTGNFVWRDDFETETLGMKWTFVRTPRKEWWQISDGKLFIEAVEANIYQIANPAFIAYRQQHLIFEAETEVSFNPQKENGLAGLVCYQNDSHNFVFGKTLSNGKYILILERSQKEKEQIAEYEIPAEKQQASIVLKVVGKNDKYSFMASFDNKETWESIAENIDARNLSTHVAGGFTGAVIGMYATCGR